MSVNHGDCCEPIQIGIYNPDSNTMFEAEMKEQFALTFALRNTEYIVFYL